MKFWIFVPPVAFGAYLLCAFAISRLMRRKAFRGPTGPGADQAYSCGEEMAENKFSPEYGQFFSYAFSFTIMHVVALVVATIPTDVPGHEFIVILYIAGAIIGLSGLLRKTR